MLNISGIILKILIRCWKDKTSASGINYGYFLQVHIHQQQYVHADRETIHKHLLGAWHKKGSLKIFDPCKITTNFPIKKWVYMIFYEVNPSFSWRKRGCWIFLRSEGRGPKQFAMFHLHHPPKCLWMVPGATWVHLVVYMRKLINSKINPGLFTNMIGVHLLKHQIKGLSVTIFLPKRGVFGCEVAQIWGNSDRFFFFFFFFKFLLRSANFFKMWFWKLWLRKQK